MIFGHTDTADMASTKKFGLTIIGGRQNVAYPDKDSLENDYASSNIPYVEHLDLYGRWQQRAKWGNGSNGGERTSDFTF